MDTTMNPLTLIASYVTQLLALLFSVSASRRVRLHRLDDKIRRIEADIIHPTEKEYTDFMTQQGDPPAGGSLSACFGKRIDVAIELLGAKIQLNRLHALTVLEDTRSAIAAARSTSGVSRPSSSRSVRGWTRSMMTWAFTIALFATALHSVMRMDERMTQMTEEPYAPPVGCQDAAI